MKLNNILIIIKIIYLANKLLKMLLINILKINKLIKLKMILIFVIIIKLSNMLINKLEIIKILNKSMF